MLAMLKSHSSTVDYAEDEEGAEPKPGADKKPDGDKGKKGEKKKKKKVDYTQVGTNEESEVAPGVRVFVYVRVGGWVGG